MGATKKPRKKYRGAKPQFADPVGWVVNGMLPLSAAEMEVRRLRNINHSALTDLVQGIGTHASGVVLRNMLITTRALAARGTGSDWLDEIAVASDAIDGMLARGERTGRYLFTGPELTAVNTAIELHDAQIDGCTISEFEKSILFARKQLGLGLIT